MSGPRNLSRREFGALVASAPLAGAGLRAVGRVGDEPWSEDGLRAGDELAPAVEAPGPIRARPFPLKQVRLLGGRCYTLQDRNRVYLHTLDADRLLHTFRLQAGLPRSGPRVAGSSSTCSAVRCMSSGSIPGLR